MADAEPTRDDDGRTAAPLPIDGDLAVYDRPVPNGTVVIDGVTLPVRNVTTLRDDDVGVRPDVERIEEMRPISGHPELIQTPDEALIGALKRVTIDPDGETLLWFSRLEPTERRVMAAAAVARDGLIERTATGATDGR